MNPLFTIIIPHYNIPDLLMRTLASIPVDERIQVIVVDDCSPDAATYKERFPELSRPYLELYSTPKGGSAGRARNVGIGHAKGEWVTFMDSDDFFADNMLGLLMDIKDSKEDIVFFKSTSVMSDDITQPSERESRCIELFEESMKKSSDFNLRYLFPQICGRVMKRQFIEDFNLRFDEVPCADDCWMSLMAGYHAKEIKIVDKLLYIITERRGSLSSSFIHKNPTPTECITNYEVMLRCQKFLDSHGIKATVYFRSARFFMRSLPSLFAKYQAKHFLTDYAYCMKFFKYLVKEKIRYLRKK